MQALSFWKTVAVDDSNLLERLIGWLDEQQARYCVIGGQAVNAYAEPVVSLDLDLVIAADQLDELIPRLPPSFRVERFPHSINVSLSGSDLRVQLQTDPLYAPFVDRAASATVLGLTLPVAALEDVLRGKIWAVEDETRRPSKRQKDLADISRLLEAYPELRSLVPPAILARLI